MHLLHVDSSILGSQSVSREVTAAVVNSLMAAAPNLEVTHRDLAAAPLPHLSGPPSAPSAEAGEAAGAAVLAEFMAADIVVIGAPMYNFTIPSQLKAWLDRILVAGQTFRYSAAGVEGLAGGKRVIIAISRGGRYGPGSPAAAAEHVETYLRAVFGFIGVADLEILVAEGLQMGPDQRQASVASALKSARELRAA